MFKNALVSCSDKTGLVEFLKPLQAKGLRIVSTGGTAEHLKTHGLTVVDVSEQTAFPEVMDGRVKTLHPHVHMALLARKNNSGDQSLLRERGLTPFDLVVVNLYPFEDALAKGKKGEELIEFIDVGGPSMLRAAAKNFSSVTVVCDPTDYAPILEGTFDGEHGRQKLAVKVFEHSATYDGMIAQAMGATLSENLLSFSGAKVQELRYGENPHQKATWLKRRGAGFGLHQAKILQGKELSYNNLLDLDAASRALRDLDQKYSCVAVKHNSPCGAAFGIDLSEACRRGLEADPVSVFGGIVALSSVVTEEVARQITALFLECVIAPEFDEGALRVLNGKKNLRVLSWPKMLEQNSEWRWRSVAGGALVQESDHVLDPPSGWQYWGEKPSPAIEQDLTFAWRICAHLKSNAIAVISGGQTVGLGMGQVNRVDAVTQALGRMQKFHRTAVDPVLASDAFFPFPDSVEKAHEAGIRWIIQPGGSVKDEEVRAAAQRLGVNVVITGQRHFLH